MKKFTCLCVIAILVCFTASQASAQAYGDSRIGSIKLNSKSIVSSTVNDVGHTHITTSPTAVYRVTFTSSDAGTYVQLFDSAGTGSFNTTAAEISSLAAPKTGGIAYIKADIGQATANTVTQVTYDPPLQFDNGVLAGFAGIGSATGVDDLGAGYVATATIEYRQN